MILTDKKTSWQDFGRKRKSLEKNIVLRKISLFQA